MLVITRKIGQSFRINDDVTITLLVQRSRGVRIGIEAPVNVRVSRVDSDPALAYRVRIDGEWHVVHPADVEEIVGTGVVDG